MVVLHLGLGWDFVWWCCFVGFCLFGLFTVVVLLLGGCARCGFRIAADCALEGFLFGNLGLIAGLVCFCYGLFGLRCLLCYCWWLVALLLVFK